MAQLEYLDPSGRSFSAPQSVEIRTAKAPAVGHLFQSLGLVVAKHTADDGSIYLTARCSGLLLKIAVAPAASDPRETTFHFGVDSLDAALRAAAERQAEVLKPPHESSWGRRAILADPDGRRIVLTGRGTLPMPQTSPTAPTETTFIVPDIKPPEASFIVTNSKPTTKPEDEATPPDLLPAIAAAKRGVVAMLVGSLAYGALCGALMSQAIQRDDIHRLNDVIEGAPAIGQIINLFILLLFIFPRSPRLRYGALWTGIGIAVSTIAIAIFDSADLGDFETRKRVLECASPFSLAAPLLVFLYLAQLARKAKQPPLVRLVSINLKLYLATVGLVVAMVAAMFVAPALTMIPLIVALIVNLAQLIAFILLTKQLVQFRPVRAKKPPAVHVGSIELDEVH